MLDRPLRRIRFAECELERLESGFHARVVLVDGDQITVSGTADRGQDPDGDLWCAAEATVAALRGLLDLGPEALILREVVQFQIEGSPAVATSLRVLVDGKKRRLFGLTQADEDRGRAAALSVLNATNRYFSSG